MKKLILKTINKSFSVSFFYFVALSLVSVQYGGAWVAFLFIWGYSILELHDIPKFYIHPKIQIGNFLIWGIIFILTGLCILGNLETSIPSGRKQFWVIVFPIIWSGYLLLRHQSKYNSYLKKHILLLECIFTKKHLTEEEALVAININGKKYDTTKLKKMLEDLQKEKFITFTKEPESNIYCIDIISPELRALAMGKRAMEEWGCKSCGAVNQNNGFDDAICEYCGTPRL